MTEPSDGPLFEEGRSAPFCFQTHDALDRIRETFTGQRRVVALGLYLVFTEIANRKGGHMARNGFQATRKEIASHAGVAVATFDRYVKDLVEAGLLEVVRTSIGSVNLPNRWRLTDVTPLASQNALPPENDAPRARFLSEEEKELKEHPPIVPPPTTAVAVRPMQPANRPQQVARRTVTDSEYELAAAVLNAFCAETSTRFASTDWISKIVGRIREHPDLNYADHQAIIRANAADPWWTGPANPSVIYGNGAQFERSMQKVWEPIPPAAVTPEDAATYGTMWGPGTEYATPAERRAAFPRFDGDFIDSVDHEEIT